MLDLARACPSLRRFTYVSTAYVAGERRGIVYEDDPGGGRFRNAYERTKHEAERLVAACREEMEVTVVRPSIVVGDHRTGWTAAFNVLYAPLRAFEAGIIPVVPARRRSPVDVVPVDYVADAILYLLDRSETGVFNLVAGSEAPTVDELIELGSERFGRSRPELVEPGEPTALADGEVYVPYFDMRVVFDDTRARELLEPAGIRAPKLRDCFDALIDYAEATRWGKRPMTREEARERFVPVAAA